jgi:hypothetical protein
MIVLADTLLVFHRRVSNLHAISLTVRFAPVCHRVPKLASTTSFPDNDNCIPILGGANQSWSVALHRGMFCNVVFYVYLLQPVDAVSATRATPQAGP